MSSPTNPFIQYALNPEESNFSDENIPENNDQQPNPFIDYAISQENEESTGMSLARYATQIPQALLATTPYGIAAGLWQMIGQGEILDPEELEHLERISEREGIPFDKEAYMKSAEEALSFIPTVSNIAREVESQTGIPLEPKTRGQKALRFATEATRLSPSKGTFRGMETKLPKPVLGAGVELTKEGLQELGVPEPISELLSFAVLKRAPEGAPELEIGQKTKPSGMVERQFEKNTSPKEVSENKLKSINEKLKSDFDAISQNIITESPIGETSKNLKNDPTFKQQSRELLDQAQVIANDIKEPISTGLIKKELADISAKKTKGISQSEYEKSYLKYMNESINELKPGQASAGSLVEQYRKNNAALSEYFEPGSSKAINRAKRDALLDQNRAIASAMEKKYPESDLVPVFKEGNSRWSKIMDAEFVDEFVSDIFSKDRVDFKKIHDFFDKPGYEAKFKRALGEKGYNDFVQLMKDMTTSEAPYKMLNVAKSKGWEGLYKTMISYMIHPKLGVAKSGLDTLKYTYRKLMNAMLDKPQIAITFRKGVKDLKAGKFAEAEKEFEKLNTDLMPEYKQMEFQMPSDINQ